MCFLFFSILFLLYSVSLTVCTPHAVFSIVCSFEFTSPSKMIFFPFLSNSDDLLNTSLSFFPVSCYLDIISLLPCFQFCGTFVASIFNFFLITLLYSTTVFICFVCLLFCVSYIFICYWVLLHIYMDLIIHIMYNHNIWLWYIHKDLIIILLFYYLSCYCSFEMEFLLLNG